MLDFAHMRHKSLFVKPLKFQDLSVAIARIAYSNTYAISLTTIYTLMTKNK